MLVLLYAFQLIVMLNGFTPLLANADRASGLQIASVFSSQNYLFIAAGSGSLILGMFIISQSKRTSPDKLNSLLIVSLIYGALTLGWSPYKSELYIYFTIFSIFLANTLVTSYIFEKISFLRIVLYTCRILVLISFATVLLIPEVGIHQPYDFQAHSLAGTWRGSFSHKNALGQFVALVFFLELTYNEAAKASIRKWQALFLTLEAICLIFANSSGAYIGFIIAISLYIISKSTSKNQFTTLIIMSPFVIILGIMGIGFILPLFGKDATFTGRTEIWNYWIGEANQNLLFGSGYFSSYTKSAQELARQALFYSSSSPHSSYIELYYFGGLLSVLFFLIIIVMFIYKSLSIQNYAGFSFVICLLVLGFTDVNALRIVYGFSALLWAVLIYIPQKHSTDNLASGILPVSSFR